MHHAGVQATHTVHPPPCPRARVHMLSPASSSKDPQARSQAIGMHVHRRGDAAQTACGESWTSCRSACTSGCRSSWAAQMILRSWRAMGMCSSSKTLVIPFRACYRAELACCEQLLVLSASSTPSTSWRSHGRGTGPVREGMHGVWLES